MLLKKFEERYSKFWTKSWKPDTMAKYGIKLETPARKSLLPLLPKRLAQTFKEWKNGKNLSDFTLRKALEMKDGKVTSIMDDGRDLPDRQRILVLTNTTSMLDMSGHHVQTAVMILELKP